MNFVAGLPFVIFVVAVPLLLVTAAVTYAFNEPRLYEYGFEKYDIARVTAEHDRSAFQILTWEQVSEMEAYGMEIGSHTCTHRQLTELSAEEQWSEIAQSRADIEDKLGRQVISFCYPKGDLNEEIAQLVETAGYQCAVVTPPRSGIPLSLYTLRRIGIYHSNNALVFRLKTMPLVRRNYEQLKRWQPSRREIR